MASVIWNPGINAYNPTVELIVNQQSQSIDANNSVLSWSLILHRPSSISSSASKAYSVKINGTTVASGSTTIGGSGDKTIASGTSTVYHNADGTKTGVPFSFAMDISISWSGSNTGDASGSGSINLTTIPRATQPTISASSTSMGNSVTINTPRASSSFTHKLKYTFGNASGAIATGVGTSYEWTVPLSLANQIPNATSGSGTITCETYNGSTLIGSKTVSFTATVPSTVKPSVSISHVASPSYSGKYVQGKSATKVTLSASGSYSSTIKSRSTTVKYGSTTISSSTASSFTSAVINYSGIITIATTVTDSRGRTATDTVTFTVLAHDSPTLSLSTQTMGSNITIYTPMGAHGFTNTLKYSFGGASGTIATGVSNSYSWPIPLSLANQIPNATSSKGTIICETYNGSTLIGSKTVSFTATVPPGVGPSVSIAKSGVSLYQNQYVQGKSKVAVTLSATGSYGSTIAARSTTVKSGSNLITSSSSNSFTSGVINYSGTITIATTVTDSRGRKVTASTTISVVSYSSAKVVSFKAYRANADGSTNPTGAYIKIDGSSAISSINSTNTKSTILRYRERGTPGWTNATTNTASYSPSLSAVVAADIDKSFEVQIFVSDYYGTAQSLINIGTGYALLDFRYTGKGMAIGKVSERDAFEIGMDMYGTVRKALNRGGTLFIEDVREMVGTTGLANFYPKPGELQNQSITPLFSLFDEGESWRSGLLMKGWKDGDTDKYSAWRITGPAGTSPNDNYYLQSGAGLTWRPKVKIIHSGNTSEIIETGSNSNGTYIKFPDGTMICTKSENINTSTFTELNATNATFSGGYRHRMESRPYPATFIEVYHNSFEAKGGDNTTLRSYIIGTKLHWGNAQTSISPTSWVTPTFWTTVSVGSSEVGLFSFFAIGRWK